MEAETSMELYDYIVVGAGSAGCVVARRLSDDSNVSVLLLEAGPEANGFWNRAPAGMAMLYWSKRYNWMYFTEPVPTLRNRKVYWPRGKALGGSSAISGMVYVRGDRRDFDKWARLGNSGWGWDDVLPYFTLSENNERGDSAIHSTKGPLAVSDPVIIHPTVYDFIEAAARCGIQRRDDFGDGDQDGVGLVQCTIRNGVRESSYDAFLKPVRHRPNLSIETGVHVCRILFHGRAADGVELKQGGRTRRVFARREIILSAGVLSSPHLLMLSGIGDGEMLQRQGISVLMHLPGVGRNLQDHFAVRVHAETTPESSYNRDLRGWRKYWQGARYVFQKRGYLALGSSTAMAFVKSSPSMDYADMKINFRPMTFSFHASAKVKIDSYHAISATVYRVRPASRGQILLRSPDPMEPPAIVPNYLSDRDDVEATLAGARQCRRIFATEPLASRVRRELLPGDEALSDEQLIDYMEREGSSVYHGAGTCKMGNDEMAVVDSRLRVRGVERVRIIDASIMPIVTSGNTNAPIIMIGEKGAAMIRSQPAPARQLEAEASYSVLQSKA